MKNKNKIVITVLIVVIVLLLGYVGYDKFLKKDNNKINDKKPISNSNNKETTTKGEKLDINSSLVQNLYNKVVLTGDSYYKYWFYNGYSDYYEVSRASETSKMALVYHNLKKSDFTPIPNATGIQKNITLNNNSYTLQENSSTGFIPYERVENTYKELFGSSDTLSKSEPMQVGPLVVEYYIYDASLNGYVDYSTVGGGTTGSFYHGEVIGAEKKGDTIVITEKVDFSDNDDGTGKITSTTNYQYTFKLSGDNYLFVSRIGTIKLEPLY